ncbi:MAG TPA: hypothetical protein VEC96_12575 [Anaerolineae bacterium]|nr:hypothetical protein [Anaerolineae bacterium]
MNIDETKPNRQNRTITLHVGNTLAEYESTYLSETGLVALMRRVEIADSLDWGWWKTYTGAIRPAWSFYFIWSGAQPISPCFSC